MSGEINPAPMRNELAYDVKATPQIQEITPGQPIKMCEAILKYRWSSR